MQKIIELDDENKIRFIYEGDIILIQKSTIDINGNVKTIEFIKKDDYNFNGFTFLYDNNIDFEFEKNDPLYSYLNKLLREDNQLIIDDDLTREKNEKMMKIYMQDDKIVISLENNLAKSSFIDKFNICIINVSYDQRSKIDQQNLDTKERLNEFFNDIYIKYFEEKQKVKKLK